jgi:hypothetical protein
VHPGGGKEWAAILQFPLRRQETVFSGVQKKEKEVWGTRRETGAV